MAKRKSPEANAANDAEYTVVARRYRPQQFADLVGQEPIARALSNAITTNRIAHAYLFTGTRGVGKTTTARILAKCLNCVKGPTPTPCDECESCRAIAVGEDIDVLEIDGASNRGIDNIRDLRANVQFRPTRSRYKIYIIDEVHQITKDAFNALLKTLEEPPPHVKFIFATTDVQKVPITILSRCQRFDFPGITSDRIVETLKAVVTGEKRKADDEALRLIARRAAGSMRDAQSLLDQLLAFADERLTVEQVHQMLGTAADDQVVALASAILSQDVEAALTIVQTGIDGGLQPGELLDQLAAYWRDLMIVNSAESATGLLESSPAQIAAIRKQAAELPLDAILAGLDVLQTAKYRMSRSTQNRVLLELAVVRLGRLAELVSLTELANAIRSPDTTIPQLTAKSTVASAQPAKIDLAADSVKKKPDAVSDATAPSSRQLTADSLSAIWAEMLSQLGMLFAKELERGGLPAIFGPNTLVLSFPDAYNRQREYCSAPDRLERVHEALRRITGAEWRLRIEPASAGSNGKAVPPPTTKPAVPPAQQHPLFRQAEQALDDKLVQMDEQFGVALSSDETTETDSEE
jgi:DNA polymerase-3 subunit gamma/tau